MPTVSTRRSTAPPPLQKVVITGGSGFLGSALAAALDHDPNHCYQPILLLDWTEPTSTQTHKNNNIVFAKVDIRDTQALVHHFNHASIIFHIASYGMSGSSQLNTMMVRDINVNGTAAVLDAAMRAGVERLVFTSTYNVVFGGQSISGGDESMPYFPLHKHPDEYSRTKAIAEKMVLEANGSGISTENSIEHVLYTCAIRPAAIWGPGEQRHTPRVVSYIKRGLFCFTFGEHPSKAKMDFVHGNNLVQAHMLAAEGLSSDRNRPSAGQAYFISDGEDAAVNNFTFFGQLAMGLGYPYPRIRVPLWIVYCFAFVTELVYRTSPFGFEPMLTRAEVFKAGVNHWFRIDKARRELGYRPEKYDFAPVLDVFLSNENKRRNPQDDGVVARKGMYTPSFFVVVLLFVVVVVWHCSLSSSRGIGRAKY